MRSDLISIIVPVYNVEKYLEQCISSIIEQSYCGNYEVILVDDGSLDCSGDICEEYARRDKRIKAFHKNNGGLSNARNFGINHSSGNIVCFVDSDDFLHKDYLNILYANMNASGSDISECGCYLYYENNVIGNVSSKNKVIVMDPEEWLTETGSKDFYPVVAWNKLYRRDLFENVRYPVGRIFEDEPTTYKLIYSSNSIARSYQKLYYYRQRLGSISHEQITASALDQKIIALSEKCDFFISKKESSIVPYCQCKYCILIIDYFDLLQKIYNDDRKKNAYYNDINHRYNSWIRNNSYAPLKYKMYIKAFLLKNIAYRWF